MIIQSFNNGETEIRFENAESIEDAKKNGFSEGVYTRYFINDKLITNYQALIRYIIEETQKTGKRFIPPTPESLRELQKKIINKQKEEMVSQYKRVQEEYKNMNMPDEVIKQFDDAIEKIDLIGMRVVL